jgi:hypothetical protein
MTVVTVEALARLKHLEPEELRGFGLEDAPFGVRFPYIGLDGHPARARWRTGLRGAGGSEWAPDPDLPVVPYIRPDHCEHVAAAGYLIVVEGESDCWAGWRHGIPVLGIPGSDRWPSLTLAHLAGAGCIYLQREPTPAPNATFPEGIEAYLSALAAHIRDLGYTGEVRVLDPPAGVEDLSALHGTDPVGFTAALAAALAAAPPYPPASGRP